MTYRGEFHDDEFSGLGHLELDDGSQYEGQFAHGKPNGEGQRSDSAAMNSAGTSSTASSKATARSTAPTATSMSAVQEQPVTAKAAMKTPTATSGSASSRKAR
jgi:hypothetical protein